jgi:hypothetical protein
MFHRLVFRALGRWQDDLKSPSAPPGRPSRE